MDSLEEQREPTTWIQAVQNIESREHRGQVWLMPGLRPGKHQ